MNKRIRRAKRNAAPAFRPQQDDAANKTVGKGVAERREEGAAADEPAINKAECPASTSPDRS